MPDFTHEKRLGLGEGALIVGIDEAGRGPLAGPVVAGACLLDPRRLSRRLRRELNDSKQLDETTRERLYALLTQEATFAIGIATVAEIDRVNILQATLLAMQRAYLALGVTAAAALVDGNRAPVLPCQAVTLIDGDALSLSIAAASIVAKVSRDRMMCALAETHPGYGWERNKGYGTDEHVAALQHLGVSAEHRRTFAPVRRHLEQVFDSTGLLTATQG